MYSEQIPHPEEVPILPPPHVSFGDHGEVAHGVPREMPKQEPISGKEGSFQMRGSEIPQESRTLFQEGNMRLLMLELFGLTSKVSTALGSAKAVPYLNLLAAPTYLKQSSQKAYERFRVMHDAIEVGQKADSFFWATQGFDLAGSSLSSIAKTAKGTLQLAGAMEKAVVAMIFAFILPIILIVVGVIGGVANALSISRNAKALKQFNEKSKDVKHDLNAIVTTLDYLQGPMHNVTREDLHAEKAVQTKLRVECKNFKEAHFTNGTRFKAIQERIDRLDARAKIKMAPEKLKKIPGWEDLFQMVRGLEGLYQELLLSKYGDESKLVDRLISFYEQLEMSRLNHNEILLKLLRTNKEELLSLKREGRQIVELAKSEIHRTLFYNALFLLMAVMILTDGMLFLTDPHHLYVANGLSIASCVLDIAYLLFDKKISSEQFLELERFFKILPQKAEE